eukprot:scaffold42493_cov68-Phaeocystis_antarctica.AAC.6
MPRLPAMSYWTGAMSTTHSRSTKSGRRSATSIATLPPREWPTRLIEGTPRESTSSATSSAAAEKETSSSQGLAPWLRRSASTTSRCLHSCCAGPRKLEAEPKRPCRMRRGGSFVAAGPG